VNSKGKRKVVEYKISADLGNAREAGVPYERDIVNRSIQFSIRVIKLYRELEKDTVGRIIGKQLLRSGTSIGANIHEAQGGQTKPDFITKITIAYKEARETMYWLKLIEESSIISSSRLVEIRDEANQITKILSSIILTAKQNLKK
jgi:four helix bundle protein